MPSETVQGAEPTIAIHGLLLLDRNREGEGKFDGAAVAASLVGGHSARSIETEIRIERERRRWMVWS